MSFVSSYLIKRVFLKVLCGCLLVCGWTERAQSKQEQEKATSFIGGIAKTVYGAAWPTATYREASLDGFEAAQGGFDVLVKLSGNSGLDNSDLWVRLAFMFRNGSFSNVQVRDHNAFWVPPFQTTKTLMSVASDMAKQYADQQRAQAQANAPTYTPSQPASPPTYNASAPAQRPADAPAAVATVAEAACLYNPTGRPVNYQYRWGDGQWVQRTLDASKQVKIWWELRGGQAAPQLVVRYTDFPEAGEELRLYNLAGTVTAEPVACENVPKYRFGPDGVKTVVLRDTP